jgi:predicted DNA-binding protein
MSNPPMTGTQVAIAVADRSQSTTFALLHELRAETRAAIDAAIELAEKLGRGASRLARTTATRIDEATAQSITDVERWIGASLAKARTAPDIKKAA